MRALVAAFALLLAGCADPSPSGTSTGLATNTGVATTGTSPTATTTSLATPAQHGADSCTSIAKADLSLQDLQSPVAAVATSKGCFAVELDHDKAPLTVANFQAYGQEGFFNGTLFHRITEGFMIQGGGMGTDGQFKEPTHPPIQNEARSSGLKNVKYSIAMARQTSPDSATNQFFVNHDDNTFLDPGPDPSNPRHAGYAVFGMVVHGHDVVDLIASTPVTMYNAPGANGHCQGDQQPSCPKVDVVIHSVRILQ